MRRIASRSFAFVRRMPVWLWRQVERPDEACSGPGLGPAPSWRPPRERDFAVRLTRFTLSRPRIGDREHGRCGDRVVGGLCGNHHRPEVAPSTTRCRPRWSRRASATPTTTRADNADAHDAATLTTTPRNLDMQDKRTTHNRKQHYMTQNAHPTVYTNHSNADTTHPRPHPHTRPCEPHSGQAHSCPGGLPEVLGQRRATFFLYSDQHLRQRTPPAHTHAAVHRQRSNINDQP